MSLDIWRGIDESFHICQIVQQKFKSIPKQLSAFEGMTPLKLSWNLAYII